MAKEIVSLTMDQLEKVSGGAPPVINPDYPYGGLESTQYYYCKKCRKHWDLEDITTGSCPNCQSTDLELRTH